MKLLLLALRLGLLAFLLSMLGCGGGDDSSTRSYFIEWNFANTSTGVMRIDGTDIGGSNNTTITPVDAGLSKIVTTHGFGTKDNTDIQATIFDSSNTAITILPVNGVHVANGKTTYVYVTYNGSKLEVDASRPAGVKK
ncbi:MAG: hypothetical protein QM758_15360 [Armatimonas sp.]